MSNRFYVNDVQIFGSNEMFECTYEELKKQGAVWADGCFGEIEIKDPQSLIDAVEKDVFGFLLDALTKDVLDEKTLKFYDRDFKDIHDKELLLSDKFEDDFKFNIFNLPNSELNKNIWQKIGWWLNEKRVFTSYILYQAIKKDVYFEKGKLKLKEGHKITASMY